MDDKILKPGDRDYVGALAAGLEILQAFDAEHPRMTLSEVAARTEMDRAKARRFLLTLQALGFVKRAGRQFELTPRVLQLGYAYQASNQYRAVIQQYLEAITAELGSLRHWLCSMVTTWSMLFVLPHGIGLWQSRSRWGRDCQRHTPRWVECCWVNCRITSWTPFSDGFSYLH